MGPHSFLNVFDGYAKLYSWQFPGNGSVYFSAKFVQSMFYNESLKIKDIARYQTFDDLVPPMSQLNKEEAFIRGLDNMNVNIYNYTGECVLLTDVWKLYVVDCHVKNHSIMRPPYSRGPHDLSLYKWNVCCAPSARGRHRLSLNH